eukprot:7202-Rhodomonas_salina.2
MHVVADDDVLGIGRYFVLKEAEILYFRNRDTFHEGGEEQGAISLIGASCSEDPPIGGRYILGIYDPGKERCLSDNDQNDILFAKLAGP